jgi:hypothetical protein
MDTREEQTTDAHPPLRPPGATRRLRSSLWLLRAVLTVHLAVLAQPVLAGMFLTGDVDAIEWHVTVAFTLLADGLLVIAAALGYVLVGRGRWWVLAAAVLLLPADGLQITMGFARVLEIHIPLGVAIVVTSVLLAGWSWTPFAARARGSR